MNFAMVQSGLSDEIGILADVAAKATLMLVLGLFMQRVLFRRWSALGSAVGNACLIGLVLLPLAVVGLPAVPWRVASSRVGSTGDTAACGACRGAGCAVEKDDEVAIHVSSAVRLADVRPTVRTNAASPIPVLHDRPRVVAPSPASIEPASSARAIDGLTVGFGIYTFIAVVLMVRIMSSLMAVARLRDASPHVVDGPWWDALERCRRRLGIARAVGLAWSPRVGVPVVLGWRRPTIVLPATLSAADANGHADAIFLHELAHVRRGDYAWNVLLRFVQAVYWPHPLIWWLGRTVAEVARTGLRRAVHSRAWWSVDVS